MRNNNYFELIISSILMNIDDDAVSETEKDIACKIIEDVRKYENWNVKRYNNDIERGTDLYSVKEFLNLYQTIIDVFDYERFHVGKKVYRNFIHEAFSIIHEYE